MLTCALLNLIIIIYFPSSTLYKIKKKKKKNENEAKSTLLTTLLVLSQEYCERMWLFNLLLRMTKYSSTQELFILKNIKLGSFLWLIAIMSLTTSLPGGGYSFLNPFQWRRLKRCYWLNPWFEDQTREMTILHLWKIQCRVHSIGCVNCGTWLSDWTHKTGSMQDTG